MVSLRGLVGFVMLVAVGGCVDLGVSQFERDTPFGVSMGGVPLQARIDTALSLGVTYYRVTATVTDRTDDFRFSPDKPPDAFRRNGLKLAMNVVNVPPGSMTQIAPTDMTAFRAAVGRVIDLYHPALIVVGNEVDNFGQHSHVQLESYDDMLAAACEVARARQTSCADGAPLPNALVAAVYRNLQESGSQIDADRFRAEAFSPHIDASPANLQRLAERTDDYLEVLRRVRPAFANVHTYVDDARSFEDMVRFVRMRTGLPVVSNEMGQTLDDPNVTVCLMKAVTVLRMAYSIWYSNDGPTSRALSERDGSLRPAGEAFRSFTLALVDGKALPPCRGTETSRPLSSPSR